jgi:hypothetical protein
VQPTERSAPEHVDGDLTELDAATLARMRGEVAKIDGPPRFPVDASPVVVGSIKKNHFERQRVQGILRDEIAQWAGYRRAQNMQDSEAYRRFYLQFGVDVLTAITLGKNDATKLVEKIRDAIRSED